LSRERVVRARPALALAASGCLVGWRIKEGGRREEGKKKRREKREKEKEREGGEGRFAGNAGGYWRPGPGRVISWTRLEGREKGKERSCIKRGRVRWRES